MAVREISTQNDRSHIAMSRNSLETWKASPNLKTVADLQVRPRSEIALISTTVGRRERFKKYSTPDFSQRNHFFAALRKLHLQARMAWPIFQTYRQDFESAR
jgi:hypothetical protein